MAEITLKSGKVITVDVSQMTTKEWRNFMNPKGTIEDENILITKCTGLSVDEIEAMLYVDLREVVKAIILTAQNPLSVPN